MTTHAAERPAEGEHLEPIGTSTPVAVVVWVALMVATLVSWFLGDGHGATTFAAISVIVVAFIKVLLVGWYFMELREAPLFLKAAYAGWCVVVPIAMVVIYLAG